MASEKEASEESALEKTALEETVVGLLKKKKMTLSLAESCTGGAVAADIVNVPGASEVFMCGYVTYTNRAKRKCLGVKKSHTEERRCCLSQMCRTDGKRRCESSQNRCLSLCDRTCRSGRWNRGNTGGNRIYGMLLCRKDNCEGISL